MQRIAPGPDQESVWDYPRPPRLEPVTERLQVIFNGVVLADSIRGLRILETSHPPTYYIPPEDVQTKLLKPVSGRSLCEFKGEAAYWTVKAEGRTSERAAWSYPAPWWPYEPLKNHYCFYASRVDDCVVGSERVQAQDGDFYGGWITSQVVGPFKGAPGTLGW